MSTHSTSVSFLVIWALCFAFLSVRLVDCLCFFWFLLVRFLDVLFICDVVSLSDMCRLVCVSWFCGWAETMAWVKMNTAGQPPTERMNTAGLLVGHKIIYIGGNCEGRKQNDVHILDLGTFVLLCKLVSCAMLSN